MEKLTNEVYQLSYKKIGNQQFAAINHTGDGFLCAFWDEAHAITGLHVALELRLFFNQEIPKLNERLRSRSCKTTDFGMALHTGGVSIYAFMPPLLKLIYGKLPNTVCRLEKKTDYEKRIILTGNFRKYLRQHLRKSANKLHAYHNLGLGRLSYGRRVDLNDGKRMGHFLFCVLESEAENILSLLRCKR